MDMIKVEEVIVGEEIMAIKVEEITKPEEEIPQPTISPMSPNGVQHESMQCLPCFITFSTWKARERHMRKHHRDQYMQQLQMKNFLFSCFNCDKSFASSEELSQHQLIHRNQERPFSCSECNQRFYTVSEFYQHRRQECDHWKSLCQSGCTDCGTLFSSSEQLRSHRAVVHSEQLGVDDADDTVQCCQCDSGFLTIKDLRQHMQECANYLYCDTASKGKKRGRKPKNASDSPKKQCSSAVLQIPCSGEKCELVFSSVAALRDHKKEAHPPKKMHNTG